MFRLCVSTVAIASVSTVRRCRVRFTALKDRSRDLKIPLSPGRLDLPNNGAVDCSYRSPRLMKSSAVSTHDNLILRHVRKVVS